MGSQRDDDHAGQIAEKLLEGWTLLAEYCPMEGCTCPLMRSRDGRAGTRRHSSAVCPHPRYRPIGGAAPRASPFLATPARPAAARPPAPAAAVPRGCVRELELRSDKTDLLGVPPTLGHDALRLNGQS